MLRSTPCIPCCWKNHIYWNRGLRKVSWSPVVRVDACCTVWIELCFGSECLVGETTLHSNHLRLGTSYWKTHPTWSCHKVLAQHHARPFCGRIDFKQCFWVIQNILYRAHYNPLEDIRTCSHARKYRQFWHSDAVCIIAHHAAKVKGRGQTASIPGNFGRFDFYGYVL